MENIFGSKAYAKLEAKQSDILHKHKGTLWFFQYVLGLPSIKDSDLYKVFDYPERQIILENDRVTFFEQDDAGHKAGIVILEDIIMFQDITPESSLEDLKAISKLFTRLSKTLSTFAKLLKKYGYEG